MSTADQIKTCKDTGGMWLPSSYKCVYTGSIDITSDECAVFNGNWNADLRRCDYPKNNVRKHGMIHESDHVKIYGPNNREPHADAIVQFIEKPLYIKNLDKPPHKSPFYKISKPVMGNYIIDEINRALCKFDDLSCTRSTQNTNPLCNYLETRLLETTIYVNESEIIRKYPVFLNVKNQCPIKAQVEKKISITPLIT